MSHPDARLTLHSRLLLCRRIEREGWRLREAAAAAGISRQTASKWLGRWRSAGPCGLVDRSSRPQRIALRVVGKLLRRVVLLRLTKRRGPAWIARHAGLAPATVYRALRRHRLHRLRLLQPREPVVRYRWPAAGDLVHLDTKRLARIGSGGGRRLAGYKAQTTHRGIGWNYAHVAVDDCTRLAYAEELAASAQRWRPASLRAPSPSSLATASRRGASSVTTATATARRSSQRRSPSRAYATGERSPTGRRPTARPRPS